jgi:serine/threonine protein kinase
MTIAKGTARGLAYLHNDMSIVHGNLTASNVLLEEQCNPKIPNFGLARMAQEILLLYKLCLLWSCSALM